MQSPAQVYLRYLLSHPDKHNNAHVKKRCRKEHIYFVDDDYLDELREDMVIPEPFRPKDRRHKPSMDFLRVEGIYGLWFRTKAVADALKILRKARVKETIEAMLVLHVPYSGIVYGLSTKHNESISEAAVDMYYHHFWNLGMLTTVEVRQACRKSEKVEPQYGSNHLVRSSPRVIASEMPSSPISAALVLMRLGFVPEKVDVFKLLPELAEVVALKAYETVLVGGKDSAAAVFQYARTLEIIYDLKNKMTPPEEELTKMMQNVTLETKKIQTPTIHQLTGGDFSTGDFEEKKEQELKKGRKK